MELDRLGTEEQGRRSFAVRDAGGDEERDLELLSGQRLGRRDRPPAGRLARRGELRAGPVRDGRITEARIDESYARMQIFMTRS